MDLYEYSGPVYEFDLCVNNHWEGTTRAISEKKARSNLTYQYKKITNRCIDSKIILPGEIKNVDLKGE